MPETKKKKSASEKVREFFVDFVSMWDKDVGGLFNEAWGLVKEFFNLFSNDSNKSASAAKGSESVEVAKDTKSETVSKELEKAKAVSKDVQKEAEKATANVKASSVSDTELSENQPELSQVERLAQREQQQSTTKSAGGLGSL